jgi:hypothetical protein
MESVIRPPGCTTSGLSVIVTAGTPGTRIARIASAVMRKLNKDRFIECAPEEIVCGKTI